MAQEIYSQEQLKAARRHWFLCYPDASEPIEEDPRWQECLQEYIREWIRTWEELDRLVGQKYIRIEGGGDAVVKEISDEEKEQLKSRLDPMWLLKAARRHWFLWYPDAREPIEDPCWQECLREYIWKWENLGGLVGKEIRVDEDGDLVREVESEISDEEREQMKRMDPRALPEGWGQE